MGLQTLEQISKNEKVDLVGLEEEEKHKKVKTWIVDSAGQNRYAIHCSQCKSKVLLAGIGSLMEVGKEIERPEILNKTLPVINQQEDGKDLQAFELTLGSSLFVFKVNTPMDYENVGFTRQDGETSVRFLCCADCDVGPIGFQEIDLEKSQQGKIVPKSMESYILPERIRYNIE